MASSIHTGIRTAYSNLVDWAKKAAGTPERIYEHGGSSLDGAGDNIPTDERYNNASSDLVIVAVIHGLVYPSNAAPFSGRGLPIEIRVPYNYPAVPPEVYIGIQLLHPNINQNGGICADALDAELEYKAMSLIDVVKLVANLIKKPDIGYPVDTDALKLYEDDRPTYDRQMEEAVERQTQTQH